MIFNPRLTSVEMVGLVCDELQIPYPAGTTSLKVLVDALSRALLDAHARGRRTVLIIDEAQNLSSRVLEEIRLLTNLENDEGELLQVILIGQPELADHLARPNLRQLAQRVTARYHLRPFTEAETHRYVQHRMETAGQRQPIFTRLSYARPIACRAASRGSSTRSAIARCSAPTPPARRGSRRRSSAARAKEVMGRRSWRRRWILGAATARSSSCWVGRSRSWRPAAFLRWAPGLHS